MARQNRVSLNSHLNGGGEMSPSASELAGIFKLA